MEKNNIRMTLEAILFIFITLVLPCFLLSLSCIMIFSFDRNLHLEEASKREDSAYVIGGYPFILQFSVV